MNRHTGKAITGEEHLKQSLAYLFTLNTGERVMRRYLGKSPDLIDTPMIPGFAGIWVYEFSTALFDAKETRFEITQGEIISVDTQGHATLKILGKNLEIIGNLDVFVNV